MSTEEQYKSLAFTDLSNGRPVVPGDVFTLPVYKDDDDGAKEKREHDKSLIDDGKILLIPAETQKKSEPPARAELEATAKKLKIESISDKNVQELQQAIAEAEAKKEGGGS